MAKKRSKRKRKQEQTPTKPTKLVPMRYDEIATIANSFDLSQEWRTNECATYRHTAAEFGRFSFFSPTVIRIPVVGSAFNTDYPENLYQSMKFPYDAELQKSILWAETPRAAKAMARSHDDDKRKDWNKMSLQVMYWVMRLMLANTPKMIGIVLEQSGELHIVENSRYDNFWGARPNSGATVLTGANVQGRIWMQIRRDWNKGGAKGCAMPSVHPPADRAGKGWLLINHPIT